ncbi:MAG: histidinol-phosphatase HisJ family protein [Chloroflexi bacterium]|nr:histidinol-phosphatase HisJ family protein [Chloroflexota bacterium]MCL5274374.1 histidinol-phosphatase HisJ family protein [Chloroflexota bacterium]
MRIKTPGISEIPGVYARTGVYARMGVYARTGVYAHIRRTSRRSVISGMGYHRGVMRVDYHVHTEFSNDCNVPMEEQCRAAIAAGIRQIAFTEHEENNPREFLPFSFDHPAYLQELAHCRARFGDRLTIRAGIEISEPHRYPVETERVLRRYPWDFVLGSLHWVSAELNTGAREFFTSYGGWRESFRAYFREMLNLARSGDFDILAHMDYPARYCAPYIDGAYDIREYEDEVRAVLRAIIERGKGIEINTSSLRKRLSAPCPPQPVVDWYRAMGGAILTVGSDAHRSDHVGADIDTALQMAQQAGFTHIAIYEHRRPRLVEIEDVRVGIGDWRLEIDV